MVNIQHFDERDLTSGDLTPLFRGHVIHADLETSYLQIVQNSDIKLKTIFLDDTGRRIGGISLWQSSYRLLNCMEHAVDFPTAITVPETQDRWWVIEKRGLKTVIYLNGRQLVSEMASSELCDHPDHISTWADDWGKKVSRVMFPWTNGQETDFYRIGRYHH